MPKSRKIFAAVALLLGVVLLVAELRTAWAEGANGNWFWLLVAALLTLFGIVEVAARPAPPKRL